jgi:hypothetical protein
METWMWVVLLIIVVGVVIYFRKSIPFLKRAAESKSPKAEPWIFATTVYHDSHFRGFTPKGAEVYAYAANVTQAFREMADAGIQRTIDIGRDQYGFTKGITHADYAVSAWPRFPGHDIAGFLVESMPVMVVGQDKPSYDQGPYDKDPRKGFIRLVVAGNFVSKYFGPDTNAKHKLALGLVDDESMTEIAAANETEHALLFANDPAQFEATIGEGHSHPLLTAPNQVRALASRPFKCGAAKE